MAIKHDSSRENSYGIFRAAIVRNAMVVIILAFFTSICLNAPSGASNPPSAAVYEMKSRVIRVICPLKDGVISGSGFTIGKTGSPVKYVVTNWHVVQANPNRIKILISRDNLITAKVKLKLPVTDLAVLELEQELNIPPAVFGDPDALKDGYTVFALGFPGAADITNSLGGPENVTLTTGTISKIGEINGEKIFQIDAAINPGMSGGPLINEDGQVVGINTAKSSDGEGIGVAIRVSELLPQLDIIGITYEKGQAKQKSATAEANQPDKAVVANPPVQTPQPVKSNNTGLIAGIAAAVIAAGLAIFVLLRKKGTTSVRPAVDPITVPNPSAGYVPNYTPTLNGISGFFAGNVVEMGNEIICIGRDPNQCQMVYPPNAQEISRLHCRISFNSGNRTFLLEDRSSNGTFLFSGEKIPAGSSKVLQSGDRFFLSDINNMFEVKMG